MAPGRKHCPTAREPDVLEAEKLLHRVESVAYADAGYARVDKRAGREGLTWHVAPRRGRVKALSNCVARG